MTNTEDRTELPIDLGDGNDYQEYSYRCFLVRTSNKKAYSTISAALDAALPGDKIVVEVQ